MDDNNTVERDDEYYHCDRCGKYVPDGEALVLYGARDDSMILEQILRLCENCTGDLEYWLDDWVSGE